MSAPSLVQDGWVGIPRRTLGSLVWRWRRCAVARQERKERSSARYTSTASLQAQKYSWTGARCSRLGSRPIRQRRCGMWSMGGRTACAS